MRHVIIVSRDRELVAALTAELDSTDTWTRWTPADRLPADDGAALRLVDARELDGPDADTIAAWARQGLTVAVTPAQDLALAWRGLRRTGAISAGHPAAIGPLVRGLVVAAKERAGV